MSDLGPSENQASVLTAYEKVNTAGTDERLFRIMPEYYLWSLYLCLA